MPHNDFKYEMCHVSRRLSVGHQVWSAHASKSVLVIRAEHKVMDNNTCIRNGMECKMRWKVENDWL